MNLKKNNFFQKDQKQKLKIKRIRTRVEILIIKITKLYFFRREEKIRRKKKYQWQQITSSSMTCAILIKRECNGVFNDMIEEIFGR